VTPAPRPRHQTNNRRIDREDRQDRRRGQNRKRK
jgi:hypothetical protein